MKRKQTSRAGNALVEFTLVGIPLMFVLISTFEMARGMWLYHTLVNAVKSGTRYASVHGQLCATSPNNCTVRIKDVAAQIQNAGVGLDPAQLNLTFTTQGAAPVACLLSDCLNNNTICPDSTANLIGNYIQIDGRYPFTSAIAMFWPGAGGTAPPGTINLPAASRERIRF
jgi:Flp pilus assembly protein TadG